MHIETGCSKIAASMANKKRERTPIAPEVISDQHVFPIVGVGASAGGIEAFTAILKVLPDDPGMAIVFVLHQDPRYASNLDHVLARATKLPVEVVRPGMLVRNNHLYIAPGGSELSIEHGVLNLHERASGVPSVIDGFFSSLAHDQGPRAISVVLSGSASDGSLGTKAIKAEGGITFAQDDSAKMDSMPRSAVAAGGVDFVMSPMQIAVELMRIARLDYVSKPAPTRLPESDLVQLFNVLRSRHDTDFSHYKPSTVERRIRRRMAVNRVETLTEYLSVLRGSPDEVKELYADILIRVTGFFRDPQVFDALQRDIFPALMRGRKDGEALRMWVPGCATGEEVYSIAIAVLETASAIGADCQIQIFGTDVSEPAIVSARAGFYPDAAMTEVSPERIRKYFSRIDSGYRVNKAVRDCCIFARQNVTKDAPFSKLDLISCRNVMIYFGTGLQRKVLSIFNYALRPDGYLILGTSESIGNFGDLFNIVDKKNKIYQKKTASRRRMLADFSLAPSDEVHERPAVEPPAEPAMADAVFREADRVLLARFTPAGVVVNDHLEVLQFRGRTSRYLEPPPGTASFNLLKMAREGLLGDLRTAIHQARKKDEKQRREGIRVKLNDHSIVVNIEVIPFIGASKERFLAVLFEEPPEGKRTRTPKREEPKKDGRQISHLKRELEATREYLQSIIEEQETMNEELRSASEEVQSSNEELQSINEELETAKEELQSSNEELTTLNEELENRNQEMALVNNDLINLLTSVEIPILMLDSQLQIRRFNPPAQRTLNLIPSDIGRPIDDMRANLQIDNLGEIVSDVIDKLEVRELVVLDRAGRRHSLRIRPYKTTDNKIDGAVLVLVDLEEFVKKAGAVQPARS